MRVYSLLLAAFVSAYSYAKNPAWNLELDYNGPGSQSESLADAMRDRDNKDSAERVNEGSTDQRDQERASQYERDHGV